MLRLRLLLLLLAVALALGAALLRPLPGRADNGGEAPPAPPEPTPPATTNPIVPPLPLVRAVRRPAAVEHHTASLFGERVISYAKRFLGVRYVWGGSSPRSGFDCSGFVRFVYGHFGISLAHSSWAQFDRGRRVSRRSLKPGDLVFFDGEGHVGIYVGDGRFIHAPHTGTRVQITRLAGWYSASFDGGRRLRPA